MSEATRGTYDVGTERHRRIAEKLERELGPLICKLLREPDVVEVMLNPDGRLWSDRLGVGMAPVGMMSAANAEALIGTVASTLRAAATRESPILECELPLDGSRFEALLPPLVSAPVFTIRRKALRIFTLEDYVASGIMTASQCGRICGAVERRQNILVVGGTGTGKTTLANAIIHQISLVAPDHRLVIIEDTPELQCASRNVVLLRSADNVDMIRLLKATMRLRPDRIIVGEVRGPEALALLKAWNTGHPGGVGTCHANNARAGMTRLEQLIAEASQSPMQHLIGEAVDLIVSIEKTLSGRQVKEIVGVNGFDGSDYLFESAA